MQYDYPIQASITVCSSEQLEAVYKALANTMSHERPTHYGSGYSAPVPAAEETSSPTSAPDQPEEETVIVTGKQ